MPDTLSLREAIVTVNCRSVGETFTSSDSEALQVVLAALAEKDAQIAALQTELAFHEIATACERETPAPPQTQALK